MWYSSETHFEAEAAELGAVSLYPIMLHRCEIYIVIV